MMFDYSNTDILDAIKQSQDDNQVTDTLGEMMIAIANHRVNNTSYINFRHKEDMVQEAVTAMCKSYVHFKPELSDDPFAYLTQVAGCAFAKIQMKEIKENVNSFRL